MNLTRGIFAKYFGFCVSQNEKGEQVTDRQKAICIELIHNYGTFLHKYRVLFIEVISVVSYDKIFILLPTFLTSFVMVDTGENDILSRAAMIDQKH